MNCRRAQSWFGSFLDQGLDAKRARVLMAHLRSCPEGAKAWERFRASLGALKKLERIEASPNFEADLWRRIHEDVPESGWYRAWQGLTGGALWPKLVGAAAAASVVFGILLVGGVLGPGEGPTRSSVAVDATGEFAAPPVVRNPDSPSMDLVGSGGAETGWDVPAWARTRAGRLEREFSGFEGMIDTAGVEPEFVIRRVSHDPNAPPMRAF